MKKANAGAVQYAILNGIHNKTSEGDMGWFQDEVSADQQAIRDSIQQLENDVARLRRDMEMIDSDHTRQGIARAIRVLENEITAKRGQLR